LLGGCVNDTFDLMMRDLWQRIERVLQTHAPDTAATLAPPATEEEIQALEAAIRLSLPADLRASLRLHNGQNDPTRCHSFCGEGILLDTKQIAERWKMVTEIDERERFSAAPGQGPWWKTSCIPFTDAEGDMLCIDMDPALKDRIGEVVCHVHDSEIERGLGASFRDWLSSLADRLDAGRFRIDDYGYLWLDSEVLPE
jgi:cell wall assembly regulator SMI1